MKNHVAEMFGIMIKNEAAEDFFCERWYALYTQMLADPIAAMKEGEEDGWLNFVCDMAIGNWNDRRWRL